MQRVVVDREGMAGEFLAQLTLEGRQVVTLLKADQYKDEQSFQPVGEWRAWPFNRQGPMICEVAAARFALKRHNEGASPLEVEVALIRDWRKLLVVEEAGEAADVQDWQADLAPQQHCFWEEGWQALPAPPAPTTPKLIAVITTRPGMQAVELAHTYFRRWNWKTKCHSRLVNSAPSGYQSWVCERAGGELRTGQTARDGARTCATPRTIDSRPASAVRPIVR